MLTVPVYDRFRNRWQQNPTGPNLSFTGNNPANLPNNNRIDSQTVGSQTITMMQKIAWYPRGGYTYIYTYDGDGRRIRKSNGSIGLIHWCGAGDIPLRTTDLANDYEASNAFTYYKFAGKRIGRY